MDVPIEIHCSLEVKVGGEAGSPVWIRYSFHIFIKYLQDCQTGTDICRNISLGSLAYYHHCIYHKKNYPILVAVMVCCGL